MSSIDQGTPTTLWVIIAVVVVIATALVCVELGARIWFRAKLRYQRSLFKTLGCSTGDKNGQSEN